jgi:hypothetical protein
MTYVTHNDTPKVVKDTHEKGKLVERSGRKATNLRLPRGERYGSRATMENSMSAMPIPPGKNHPVRRPPCDINPHPKYINDFTRYLWWESCFSF